MNILTEKNNFSFILVEDEMLGVGDCFSSDEQEAIFAMVTKTHYPKRQFQRSSFVSLQLQHQKKESDEKSIPQFLSSSITHDLNSFLLSGCN